MGGGDLNPSSVVLATRQPVLAPICLTAGLRQQIVFYRSCPFGAPKPVFLTEEIPETAGAMSSASISQVLFTTDGTQLATRVTTVFAAL